MSLPPHSCPLNSFTYRGTHCACNPGHVLLNRTENRCVLPWVSPSEVIISNSGIESIGELTFPATVFQFDSLRRFTQSQAVFLEGTLGAVLIWLLFCFVLRLGNLKDGKGFCFRMRWWISRLDICYATRHWLDDRKAITKRKTELGGAFSVSSWILFIGLFAALLYEIASRRTIETHNVRATSAPDLVSFVNDIELNITTMSSMSCAHLRDDLRHGFMNGKASTRSCHNTSNGPILWMKCGNCSLMRDPFSISWQYVDLPNDPATAVGFQFNLTAKNTAFSRHVSSVSGTLQNSKTFRGRDPNVLKLNLFPRVYHNHHSMKLLQPLFHDFLPGSSIGDISELRASLINSTDGLVNITLYIDPLSSYIVEIRDQNVLSPVCFLADVGGLFCFSVGFFLYLLLQCEFRIKMLRDDDAILHRMEKRRKALQHWDKLRRYVRYTWGRSKITDVINSVSENSRHRPFMFDGCSPRLKADRRALLSTASTADSVLVHHRAEPPDISKIRTIVEALRHKYDTLGDELAAAQHAIQSL